MIKKLKYYYFDNNLLNEINLNTNKSYTLDFIISKIINKLNKKNTNTILLSLMHCASIHDGKLDIGLLKKKLETYIKKKNINNIPNYLDTGYIVNYITI
jgi:hypothetical protein